MIAPKDTGIKGRMLNNRNRRSKTHFMFPTNSLLSQGKNRDFFKGYGTKKQKKPLP